MQEGSGLTWDTGALKGYVTPCINEASKNLKSASDTISNLPTPDGCGAARRLSKTVDNIKKSVDEVKTDVQDAAESLEQNENNIQDFLGSLWDKFKDLFNLPQENKDTETNTDEEKLKDPLSENNPFEDTEDSAQIPKSVEKLAKDYNIDTNGKTNEEIITEAIKKKGLPELAKTYGVETTEEKTIKKSRI